MMTKATYRLVYRLDVVRRGYIAVYYNSIAFGFILKRIDMFQILV